MWGYFESIWKRRPEVPVVEVLLVLFFPTTTKKEREYSLDVRTSLQQGVYQRFLTPRKLFLGVLISMNRTEE
jgi:hypothetical protein